VAIEPRVAKKPHKDTFQADLLKIWKDKKEIASVIAAHFSN